MARREPKQERSARTRAAIVRAGAEVFAEAGFAGASVNKIARRAELTLGALYFHFESKEELAREIVREQPAQVVVPEGAHGLQGVVDVTLSWATRLPGDLMLLAGARLVMDQEYFVDPERGNSHDQWFDVLLPFLREAADEGELRGGVDPEMLARLLVNLATGAQMNSQLENGRQDLPERIRQMWCFLLPLVAVDECAARIMATVR